MSDLKVNKTFSDESLSKLFSEKELPDFWKTNINKVTYNMLIEIFSYIDEQGLTSTSIIPVLSLLCGGDMKARITKASNFKQKMLNFAKKNKEKLDDFVDCLYDFTSKDENFVGPLCQQLGLTRDKLNPSDLHLFFSKDASNIVLTNGIMLEIKAFCFSTGLKWEGIYQLFVPIFPHDIQLSSFKWAVENLTEKKNVLRRCKQQPEEFLNLPFDFPNPSISQKMPCSSTVTSTKQDNKNIQALLDSISELESKVSVLYKSLKDESLEKIKLAEEVAQLRTERNKISVSLGEAMTQLGQISTRNVNKRINRQKSKVASLQDELSNKDKIVESLNESNSSLNERLANLNERLSKTLKSNEKYRKKNQILKKKNESLEIEKGKTEQVFESHIQNLNNQIRFLENEKLELEEKIKLFLENNEIQVFKNGIYNDNIRAVYEDLLCMGLGTRNVESVIRIVLKQLAGFDIGRLPKATFAKYMLLEARGLAQIHLLSELSGEKLGENNHHDSFSDLNTLHSDGTSKKGHSFLTYDINTHDGKCLVAGLRPTSSGDAETQLNVFKEILEDISGFSSDESFVSQTFASIKNLMSDRCATQKKFNRIFTEYRESVLPTVTENWKNLSEDEKAQVKQVNEFFCGLHFIVGLADQAEACLKVWESLLFGNEKVGSVAKGGYSNGESGVTRLIRTVCKSVQERGCEKSGRMVQFSTFMKENYNMGEIPLHPFLGNRFNILFLNGAGVFYLYPQLIEFFSTLNDENKLLKAVYNDLNVLAYKIGCKALGLVHKKVTGPLWRKMVSEKNALNMTEHYKAMLAMFEKWSSDSTSFLFDKEEFLFSESSKEEHILHDDEIFKQLMSEYEHDKSMVKPLLEMIFSSFVSVSKRMLDDHLEGKLANPSEDLRRDAKSVPTTNVSAERDFGMLDRLMRIKPKALDMVYEGIIMFNLNKTKEWRDSLSKSDLAEAMKRARKSKKIQTQTFFKRRQTIYEERAEKLKTAAEEKERKARDLAALKERLTIEIEDLGGLWVDETAIDSALNSFSTIKDKRAALKIQLDFRNKVLGIKCDRSLFFLSSHGINRTVKELKANLLKVIEWKETEEQPTAPQDFSEPVLLPENVVSLQKVLLLGKTATSDSEVSEKVPQKRRNTKGKKVTKAKKARTEGFESNLPPDFKTPVVSSPSDLVGKIVNHFCDRGGDEGWYKGVILRQIGKSSKNPKFLIQYVEDDLQGLDTSVGNLFEDFKRGELCLSEITPEDFLDAKIEVYYENDENELGTWWQAKVADIDVESNQANPSYYVYYKACDLDADSQRIYFLEPLMENYLNGVVRFLDCPRS